MKMLFRRFAVTATAAFVFTATTAFAQDDGKTFAKPLRVFILAGQSNTVGHANGHTMGTLFNADGPKDKALADLVFRKDALIARSAGPEASNVSVRFSRSTTASFAPWITSRCVPRGERLRASESGSSPSAFHARRSPDCTS